MRHRCALDAEVCFVIVVSNRSMNVPKSWNKRHVRRRVLPHKPDSGPGMLKDACPQLRNLPRVKRPPCAFPDRYTRSELPCTIEQHGISVHRLTWVYPLENLDYEYYLPIFFDGLRCTEMPLCFMNHVYSVSSRARTAACTSPTSSGPSSSWSS